MHKNGLIASSLMIAALVMVSQSPLRPAVVGEGNACATKQGNPTSAENKSIEVDGIRFEVFVTEAFLSKDQVEQQALLISGRREIRAPQKPSKKAMQGEPSENDGFKHFEAHLRATNCTNQEIQFERFGSVDSKLMTADGQAIKAGQAPPLTELVNSRGDSDVGLVRLKPSESINIDMGGVLKWEGNRLFMALTRRRFYDLQPGETYQLQLTYLNNNKYVSQTIPKIWKQKVTPPPVTFRLVEPQN
jgi:hypothetical protein